MIRICPVVHRAWWRVKTFFYPRADQTKRPAPVPSMRKVDDMLATAIFDLSEVLDRKK